MTRVHAIDTPLAVPTLCYTAPRRDKQTITRLPYGEK
jgi:hypothetical protein